MEFTPTAIPDVICIRPKVFEDERGYFMETFRAQLFAEEGIQYTFVQDNHSSSRQGVLRGLHYQIHQAQGKLVRVILGEVFDVAVDLRRSSPTFGRWVAENLSGGNKKMIWIPPGFAHGFYVISEQAEVAYKTTEYYAPEWDRVLMWNDPKVGITWPLINGTSPELSERDSQGVHLAEVEVYE
jgi:dTDP-4-dehydrorhamnose 3,5-epimerase